MDYATIAPLLQDYADKHVDINYFGYLEPGETLSKVKNSIQPVAFVLLDHEGQIIRHNTDQWKDKAAIQFMILDKVSIGDWSGQLAARQKTFEIGQQYLCRIWQDIWAAGAYANRTIKEMEANIRYMPTSLQLDGWLGYMFEVPFKESITFKIDNAKWSDL